MEMSKTVAPSTTQRKIKTSEKSHAMASSSSWFEQVQKSEELDREAEDYRDQLRSSAAKKARRISENTGVTVTAEGEIINSIFLSMVDNVAAPILL